MLISDLSLSSHSKCRVVAFLIQMTYAVVNEFTVTVRITVHRGATREQLWSQQTSRPLAATSSHVVVKLCLMFVVHTL